MKTLIAIIFTLLITAQSELVLAQESLKITGKIVGKDSRPLDGASVYLLRGADSVLVKTTLANNDGSFALTGLNKGIYRLSVTMMGFAAYRSDTFQLQQQDLAFPLITLSAKGTLLKEVTIKSSKPLVEQKIDRTVVNVDALISNAGSSAMDVLEKSPGVTVEQGGAISLKGKGNVQVYVDDKPVNLSGAELENYLRSLSSSTIDQVELMSNPPAKYDAGGTGGIINIRRKRSKAAGFNGGINLSYSQGRYGKTNNSFNFNYRDNKFNIFGNLGYSTTSNYNDLDINRHFENSDGNPISSLLQTSYIRPTSQSYSSRIGMDYYASDRTTFGMAFTGLSSPGDLATNSTSQITDSKNVLDSTTVANNRDRRHFTNTGFNLNYRHQYAQKGQELTADADYLTYHTNHDQSFNNITYLPDGSITNQDLLTGHIPATIRIYTAKADYTQPLAGDVKLAAGLKTSYTQTDNTANYFNTVGDVTTPDYDKTNHFIYKEQINAGYININKDFRRFSLQAGLRFENTISDGHQLGNIQKPDSVFKRNYNGLFPTLFLQYKLDTAGNQSLGLNYGRRIDRPAYQDLNPFLSPIDKFTYYTGNPFLKPSYTQNIDLSHSYKNITTTLSYSKTKDDMYETIEILNGIYYSRPGNIGSTVNLGLSVDAGFDPASWFSFHIYAYGGTVHTVSNFYTGTLDTRGSLFIVDPMLQFKLAHDWTMQLDGSYQGPHISAQVKVGERKRLNMGIAKKLSASTTIRLVVNDVFRSYVNSGVIGNLALTRADYHNVMDTRTAVISFSYRFGKVIAGQRRHEANGAEDEKNRVKQ
ncbi:TonB-dependent receptor [Mucilaginibacter sp. SJ]|uniref:TonB-dependent receptor n=1 Tax=Mucilaginibacter sp. SJ TaxID=3029053 RepID=UPI0023A95451|nr:TonB-dependent receptor [Mucilaginibacter sp. SJ]WEA00579.1 TonB-dependent receptor [Mucilaginibacter sp. SJ]